MGIFDIEYRGNISASSEYTTNILVLIKNIGEYIGIPSTNSAVGIFDIEYHGNIPEYTQICIPISLYIDYLYNFSTAVTNNPIIPRGRVINPVTPHEPNILIYDTGGFSCIMTPAVFRVFIHLQEPYRQNLSTPSIKKSLRDILFACDAFIIQFEALIGIDIVILPPFFLPITHAPLLIPLMQVIVTAAIVIHWVPLHHST